MHRQDKARLRDVLIEWGKQPQLEEFIVRLAQAHAFASAQCRAVLTCRSLVAMGKV
jgi:hypothetical protein